MFFSVFVYPYTTGYDGSTGFSLTLAATAPSALRRPSALPMTWTFPAIVTMGLMFKSVPITELVLESRPPFLRYSSVSTTANRQIFFLSASSASKISCAEAPAVRIFTASSTKICMTPTVDSESTM